MHSAWEKSHRVSLVLPINDETEAAEWMVMWTIGLTGDSRAHLLMRMEFCIEGQAWFLLAEEQHGL